MSEREARAEVRGAGRARVGRAEEPDLGHARPGRHRAHGREPVAGGQGVGQEPDEIGDLVGKARDLALRPGVGHGEVGRRFGAPAEGERRAGVAPGRAADPEVDAPRVERLEQPELLGDLERAVVSQHHAARADADPARAHRDLGDQDLGGGAREPGGGVVLGQPVAVIAEPIGGLREVEGLPDGFGRGPALTDRRLVEDTQTEDGLRVVGHPMSLARPGRAVLLPFRGCGDQGASPRRGLRAGAGARARSRWPCRRSSSRSSSAPRATMTPRAARQARASAA